MDESKRSTTTEVKEDVWQEEEELPPEVLVPVALSDKDKNAFLMQEEFIENEDENKIRVVLRIRPLSNAEISEPDRRRRSYKLNQNIVAIPGSKYGELNFKFKRIYAENASNDEVFGQAKDLVLQAVSGYNSTIFAYGQTGSGKTYTLQGDGEKYPGIAQLSFKYLFDLVKEQQALYNFEISVTMVEIYYTDLDDLLSEFRRNIPIRIELDENQLVRFKNATEFRCVDLLVKGHEELQKKYEDGKW